MQYQRFNADLEDERNFKITANSLRSLLQQISRCPKSRELKLPVRFISNSNILDYSYNFNHCSGLDRIDQLNYTINIVGFTKHVDLLIRWIMIGSTSVYKNKRLLAVTYNEGRLQSFRRVGIFKDNLSRKITTAISVEFVNGKVLISSKIDRNTTYPIRQQGSQTTSYMITTDGNIVEHQ